MRLNLDRQRERRSRVAIQPIRLPAAWLDCFVSLAMKL
jgi:hypothetical protein